MAYQLEYEFDNLKKTKYKGNKNMIILSALMLTAAAIILRLGGTATEVFLLGNREHLGSSATQMVEQLRDGASLDDAVYAFCEEIFYAEDNN